MPDEPAQEIILHGSQKMLKPVIMQILAFKQIMDTKDWGNIYGIPCTSFQDVWRFHPQAKLIFGESSYKGMKRRTEAEISFRLVGETEKTMTPAKALILAEKIKVKFATGSKFIINKGKLIVTYLDKVKGYDFRLRVINETEGRRVIKAVMDLQDHTPEWERLTLHESKAEFPELPSKELIYGEQRRPPRRRPVALTPFRYAELHVWGLPYAVTLVDTTGTRSEPLLIA